MQISYFGKSDRGKKRKKNEDFILTKKIDQNEYLFIISDGMGGHRYGEVASKLASLTFSNVYQKKRKAGIPAAKAMEESIFESNLKVYDKSYENQVKSGMGTTVSVLVVKDEVGYIAHVGDSRIYLIRGDHMIKLTQDHTLVEKLVENGHITEKEAKKHPRRNILYQSIGIEKEIKPYFRNDIHIKDGDIFVICSDGLSNMIEEEVIEKEVVLLPIPKDAVMRLIKLANQKGGFDNISVQIIRFGEVEALNKTLVLNKRKKKIYIIIGFFFIFLLLVLYMILRK
jgi:protein phosphatase